MRSGQHTPTLILQGYLLSVFAVTPWRLYMNEADSQPSSLTFIHDSYNRCRGGTQLYVPSAHAPPVPGTLFLEAL